jgi:hypothetical protein
LPVRRQAWQTPFVRRLAAHGRCSERRRKRFTGKNRFIVVARECGDNPLNAGNIRNSISLTIAASRRIICTANSTARSRRKQI